MATSSEIQVTEAYIGLLGRAPDPAGLAYWAAELDAAIAAGQDPAVALKKLTNDITLSDEWDTGIGANDGSTLAGAKAIVTSMYDNLFDRTPPSAAELDYWAPKIVSGEFTPSEMAVALIQGAGTIDAQVLGFKQQAATYYVETVPQENFSRESAGEAVASVNGPISLQESQTATDYVATGVGVTTELTKAATPANVTMTAGDDVVTGTVGTGATYTTQNILDTSSADSDTVTLTGDAGFTIDDITKVEAININLSDTVGGGFTINAAKALNSTINLDVAETVTVVGVDLAGETVATVNNLASTNLNTTDVTTLTVSTGGGAANISGDADLATVTVSGIDANDTSITLGASSVDLDISGTAGTKDATSVSGVGAVALDVTDGGQLVESLTLSGNGGAVTYTVTNATAASMTYAVTGSQNVTLAGAGDQFTTSKFSDTSTGSTTLALSSSSAATVDVSTWGVLSGGINLTGNYGAQTLMAASGNTIKISAAQTNTITLDTNDGGTSSALTLDVDKNTVGITTADVDSLTLDLGTNAITIGGALNAADNDATLTIAGTNDVTITGATSGGDITIETQKATLAAIDADGDLTVTTSGAMSASGAVTVDNDVTISADDINIGAGLSTASSSATDGSVTLTATGNDADTTGTVDIDGSLTVTAADQFTTAGALNAENDITITADDYVATLTVDTQSGNLTITATNDVDLNGAVGVDGVLTISQTGTGGSVDFTGGSLDVDNDSTITGDDIILTAVTVNAGNLDVTATGNDVNLDGTVDVSGNLTVTTAGGNGDDVDADGVLIGADNDITITSADQIIFDQIKTAVGDVTLTAGNEVTLNNTTGDSDVDGTLTITSNGAGAAGEITLADAINAENDVTLSGTIVDIDDALTVQVGNLTVTAANDIELITGKTQTVTTGSITLTVTGGNTMDITAASATAALSASNDITASADDVVVGNITSTASGNVTLTATNDVSMLGDVDSTVTQGNITVTGGGNITLAATKGIDAENDVTITASAGGNVVLNDGTIDSAKGDIVLTGGQIDGTGAITAADGDITFNSTNDSLTSTLTGTITATTGTVQTLGGKYAVTRVDANAAGVTLAGDTQGTFATVNANASAVRITSSGDITLTTVDTPIVASSGSGDMALGSVSSSTGALVQIETAGGDDSVTLNQAADKFLVDMGGGADSVTATATLAGSVINLGDGDDTLTPTATAYNGTTVGGDGSDKVVLASGNYSADGVWQEIEVIQLGGAVTLSEAQLDNDSTFQITGSNAVITATGVTSVDLSSVTFQAGNTSSFNLTGSANADTITGSDAADTINGANGVDTLAGGVGADNFVIGTAAANRDTITDFTAGAGGDKLQIAVANTTLATADNVAPVTTDDTTAAGVGGGAYAMTGPTSATADVVILQSGAALSTGANGGDLSAATDGTELLKALTTTAAADTYTGITVGANEKFYAIAYQGGNAYVYYIEEAGGDTLAGASEIHLVATLTGVAADGMLQANLDLIP